MDKTQKKWFYLSLAFSMAILVFILASTFNEDTLQYLTHINIWFLLIAIGLRFVSFSLWAARIKVMAASLCYQVKYSHCYNMVVANLLIGAITPGQAGGEPVRITKLQSVCRLVMQPHLIIMERARCSYIVALQSSVSHVGRSSGTWEKALFVIFFSLAVLILFVVVLFAARSRVERQSDASFALD